MKIFISGVAGFIGMHVAQILLSRGDEVFGFDNLNDYYDPALKRLRLAQLLPQSNFRFLRGDVSDYDLLASLFMTERFTYVIHLAAQAGVRYSISNPSAYVTSNLVGFANILEVCRQANVSHLVYASSSSVYGANREMPFSVSDNVDHPISLYAATKKSNELMAHSYSHLFDLPTTGLRYFTVYGPWGRPDMAPWLFSDAILDGRPITVFNNGEMWRDFTYIDDIAQGTVLALNRIPRRTGRIDDLNLRAGESDAPYSVYNIGNSTPVRLLDFISSLEIALGRTAIKEFKPMQPGDVVSTSADTDAFVRAVGFSPQVNISDGLPRWAQWFSEYKSSKFTH
ncbi:NAD-dependent epimerase [Amphibiibacter pelophylacis]|uniref:NAD-dependent epimerase n=1 Tax=Amphibiibacter pelophylacis TaxID=1799477 RepID=A0ACC6P0E7_9BURK